MTPQVRRLLRELVDAALVDREDRAVVHPVLTTMVRTALNDFNRYYDSRHAATRVRDFDILTARNKAAKQAGTPRGKEGRTDAQAR